MCDYSLMTVPNRLAVRGEELKLCRFRTGSIGFGPVFKHKGIWGKLRALIKPDPPLIAVCIPPGAQLELRNIPFSLQVALGVKDRDRVTFTEINSTEQLYRDAVKFPTGDEVLLQRLPANEHARVLNLAPPEDDGFEEQDEAVSSLKAA